jgi:hypothetical protein
MILLAFVALVLTTGCPFESDVPLGGTGPEWLDPQLQGRWVAGTLYHKFIEIDCIPFSKDEYYVELRLEGKEPERYRATTARVGGEPFLIINEVRAEMGRRPFYFARYSIGKDGSLSLRFVGDQAVPKALATDQKALEKFLASHLEGTFLDDTEPPSILRRPSTTPPLGETKASP